MLISLAWGDVSTLSIVRSGQTVVPAMALLRNRDHVLAGGAVGNGVHCIGYGDPCVFLVLGDGAAKQVPA